MAINLNQFSVSPRAGEYVTARFNPAIQARIASGEAGNLKAGMFVKITTDANGHFQVLAAGVTDKPIGVIAFNPNSNSYVAGDDVSIAGGGDIVWMQSTAAAISAGAKVEFNTLGQVLTSAGTNTIVGVAMTAVPSAGGLVAVKIASPYSLV